MPQSLIYVLQHSIILGSLCTDREETRSETQTAVIIAEHVPVNSFAFPPRRQHIMKHTKV